MPLLNKKSFLDASTCLTKGWYTRSDMAEPLTYSEQFRIDEGVAIGKMARTLYPDGILIDEGSNEQNHARTQELILGNHDITLFEATFIYQDAIARADILRRIDGLWHLIEVKSHAESDETKEELIEDLSYTTLILDLCGIHFQTLSLMRVSKDYRLGMSHKDFFVSDDHTDGVSKKLPEFKKAIDSIMRETGKKECPKPTLILACKKCQYFEKLCLGKTFHNPIFDLPRLSQGKFSELVNDGIFQIEHVSDEFKLTPTQIPVRRAIKTQSIWLDKKALKNELDNIVYPVYYLDFETVSTAIPNYEGIGPYKEIITQYSLHIYSAPGVEQKYCMYLADHTKDDRRQLALRLLNDISDRGSVIVYHRAAEIKFIKNLAAAVPDLAESLLAIIDRIVDLKVILNKGYYHPEFHGSYSIKVVLPVLVPEMSYEGMEIGDGLTASAMFANLARGKYSHEEASVIRNNLLEYCKQDTLAMVKIHERLIDLIRRVTRKR